MDFVADRFADGRALRIFTLVDVFTRENLALEVDLSLSGERVKRVLEQVVEERGARPEDIRVDNVLNARTILLAGARVSATAEGAA